MLKRNKDLTTIKVLEGRVALNKIVNTKTYLDKKKEGRFFSQHSYNSDEEFSLTDPFNISER